MLIYHIYLKIHLTSIYEYNTLGKKNKSLILLLTCHIVI